MSRERPKVAVFSPYLLERGRPDGVKDYIQTLRPVLERKGVEVTLIGPSTKDNQNNLADYTLGSSVKVKMKGTSYKGTATVNIVGARRIIKAIDPDIIEFHEPFANPLTVETISFVLPKEQGRLKIPEIFQFHANTEGLTLPQKLIVFGGRKTGFMKHVMNRVSERHAVSPDTRRFWANINEESEDLYEVIPNPIDTELFNYNGREKEKKSQRLIVCTTRHDDRKGIDDLIFAVDHLIRNDIRDFIVKITGEGPKTPELKNLVKRLGLSDFVKFVGTLPVEELAALTREADLLIAPSKGREGFNRTIGNARAAGTLVVATRISGQTFAYGPEETFGKMCLPNNPIDLAARIDEFLHRLPNEEKEKRRERGRRYVEKNFSTEVVAQKKVAAYERVIYHKEYPYIFEAS